MSSKSKTKLCPKCASQIPLPADKRPMTLTCPDCGVSLKLKRRSSDHRIQAKPNYHGSPTADPFGPPEAENDRDERPSVDLSESESAIWPTTEEESSIVQSEKAKPVSFPLSVIWAYRLFFFLIWWGPLLPIYLLSAPGIILASEEEAAIGVMTSSICLVCFWLPVGLFLARFLARLAVILFVRTIRCPGCKESYAAVSRWGCSCGYVMAAGRECHIVSFRCAVCGGYLSRFNCDQCESTIIVQ